MRLIKVKRSDVSPDKLKVSAREVIDKAHLKLDALVKCDEKESLEKLLGKAEGALGKATADSAVIADFEGKRKEVIKTSHKHFGNPVVNDAFLWTASALFWTTQYMKAEAGKA